MNWRIYQALVENLQRQKEREKDECVLNIKLNEDNEK
jgi:hypothetical protein